MELRPLGRSGLLVSPICFGGNVFGWTANAATSFSLLDAWLDAGFNFIDTADVYSAWVPGHSGGESETLIGQWLKHSGRRHQVVLATKVGKPMGPGLQGLRPAYIRQAVDASLKRLQTDYIDLYQSHDDDGDTPIEDTLGAYADLIRIGKVRSIGASNYTAPRFAQALDVSSRLSLPRYETLQPLYNLYDRAVFEDGLQDICSTHGIGVINFYALAAGFLTGKYRTESDAGKSARGAKTVASYLNPRGLRILQALDEVAAETNASPAQIATAWLMQRPTVVAPIASATSLAQLQELVAASQLRLSAEEIARLDTASVPD
jgi:aryl-alcohol dehydrogenase-like predicted oxidoreductase